MIKRNIKRVRLAPAKPRRLDFLSRTDQAQRVLLTLPPVARMRNFESLVLPTLLLASSLLLTQATHFRIFVDSWHMNCCRVFPAAVVDSGPTRNVPDIYQVLT